MNITIHRGVDQIGGCVTEYEYNGWRLFVDYGEQLPGTPETSLQVEGLTHGDLSRSVLLITHYHGDHVGCITDLPEELPIYIGKTAKEILGGLSEHLGHVDERQAALYARLKYINTFSPGNLLEWGEFKIMPIIMDHSAFDAYAFRIEAGGLKVFHTGDFRTHGFRSAKLTKVIEKYVGKVDYMVCEATNVCRTANNIKPEHELQKEFIQAFTENKYNVVYLSSTNIDRLFSLYHAALKANRPFYVDSYQKKMMDIVAGRDTIWGKSRLYRYREGSEPIVLHRDGDNFRVNEKFVDFLSDRGYVIIARAGERFDNLLSRIPSEGRKTYLSMWNGYLDKSKAAYSPTLAKSVGSNCEYSHTSGHCDMESLENLVEMLRPKAIIPIHTDSPKTFAELFSDRWPVLIMKDGDTFRPIKDTNYDENLTAQVFAYKPLTDDIEIVENSDSLEAWSLDDRCIGEFLRKEDAIWALHHCVYAPERLLGYGVEDNEDFAPWYYMIYDKELNLLSTYTFGGHNPNGENWQEKSLYSSGDIVSAIYYGGFNVIIPCEVIGPITEEFARKQYEEDDLAPDTFSEYLEGFWDWDWDTIIVKPLVRVKNGSEELPEFLEVNRIYLFQFIEKGNKSFFNPNQK